jgi:5-methylcytosine-specific restriction endonuclease McrA
MSVDLYLNKSPGLDSYWRGLILFGANTASYKFAFSKALLELKPQGGDLLKLEDLAPVYARHLVEHLKRSPKQITRTNPGKFIEALKTYGIDSPDQTRLVAATVKDGFNDVVGAFQNLRTAATPFQFYEFDKEQKGLRITDQFSRLLELPQSENLSEETEARWNLVERAWELGVSVNLISVDHDPDSEMLFTIDRSQNGRRDVTSAKPALNGYQKGRCFYCFTHIEVADGSQTHVDHFFPHRLKTEFGPRIDGVWNLVLSCRSCNSEKSGRLPHLSLVERIQRRNDYLISSHHPLRETLILQTGNSAEKRKDFFQSVHHHSLPLLGLPWTPEKLDDEVF